LQRNGRDLKQSPLWSETPTASESSPPDGREFRASTTCELFPTPRASKIGGYSSPEFRPTLEQVINASPLSPVGSLANLIPLQASVKRLLTIVTCGPRLPVSFARFARDGSSGRMCAVSSTPSLDGSLVEFSGTWPTWGIALDGACGELPTLERCTNGSESSSWPTPHGICAPNPRRAGPSGNELGRAVNRAMWPTPTVNGNYNKAGLSPTSGDGLATAVRLWPTPSANEDAAGTPNGKMQKMLGNHPDVRGSGDGSLNPTWVEWLMGFPLGWTALEPSEMPSSRSKPTRSSKRSRNTNGE
jgi:hypothetical protein